MGGSDASSKATLGGVSAKAMGTEEYVMVALTVMLVPLCYVELFGVSAMRAAFPRDPETAEGMPQPSEMRISLATAAVIIVLRFWLTEAFKPLGRRWLSPRNRVVEDRVQRFTTVFFKFLFYVCITSVGFAVLKDEPWFPTALGGGGSVERCYETLYTAPSRTLRTYFLVQLGYHLHSLVYMVFLSPMRSDFMVNLVHHVATVLLISGSFLANFTAFGALVVFTHDIGDVTAYGVKCVMDAGHLPLTLSVYTSVLVSWAYTRLYVFPYHLIATSVFTLPRANPEVPGIFKDPMNIMLCILVVLHAYWYGLIVAMGAKFLHRGVVEDIIEKCSLPEELPGVTPRVVEATKVAGGLKPKHA